MSARTRGGTVGVVDGTRSGRAAYLRGRVWRVAIPGILILVVASCAVTGQAVGARGDLSDRAVRAADFPVPGATRVPQTAVAFALDGLSGSDPAATQPHACTPPRLDPQGAVVLTAITSDGASSYTSGISYADDTVSDVVSLAQRCQHVTTGTGAAQGSVTTVVQPAPPASTGVATTSIRRISVTGGDAQHHISTSTLTLIAQRAQVRVLVQYRWRGETAIDPAAAAGLDSLFTAAVAAAFD